MATLMEGYEMPAQIYSYAKAFLGPKTSKVTFSITTYSTLLWCLKWLTCHTQV